MPKDIKIDGLRGNQEVFLAYIVESDEYKAIVDKHLKNEFLGIDTLLRRISDINSEHGEKMLTCAAEISSVFHLTFNVALDLLVNASHPALRRQRYLPKISRDGDEVVIRIGVKTTQADIKVVWNVIKGIQKEIGGVSSKNSINPQLAYCIHREHILNGTKMADVFRQYLAGQLEGYRHKPTILDENEFRKYYRQIVKGL